MLAPAGHARLGRVAGYQPGRVVVFRLGRAVGCRLGRAAVFRLGRAGGYQLGRVVVFRLGRAADCQPGRAAGYQMALILGVVSLMGTRFLSLLLCRLLAAPTS